MLVKISLFSVKIRSKITNYNLLSRVDAGFRLKKLSKKGNEKRVEFDAMEHWNLTESSYLLKNSFLV